MGRKKRCAYCMKVMSAPTVTAPANESSPPYQKTIGDCRHAEQLDRRKEYGERRDRILVGFHVDAIQFGELLLRFSLAVEDLHDAHAADVFLQERIDARDGGADPPVGVAHAVAEDPGCDHDQRQHGKGGQRQPPVLPHHHRADAQQHDGVVGHGRDTGGEQIVQRVDVRRHARYQAPHRAAVEETHRQALHALEDFFSQIVERLLPHVLHDPDLQILHGETQQQRGERDERNRGSRRAEHPKQECEWFEPGTMYLSTANPNR